jgi:hypothetical protein
MAKGLMNEATEGLANAGLLGSEAEAGGNSEFRCTSAEVPRSPPNAVNILLVTILAISD